MARAPQLWVVAGPNGAGKTTLVTRRVGREITVINPDVLAQELPRVEGRLDERTAGTLALARRRELLSAGVSFGIETTLSGHGGLRFMAAAQSAGFKVNLVYVGLHSAALSAQRVGDRVRRGGHLVPVSAALRRYPDSLVRLRQAFGMADRSFILDNSGVRRRLLLVREAGRTRFIARDLPPWLVEALPELT